MQRLFRSTALAFSVAFALVSPAVHAQEFDDRWYEVTLDPFQSDLEGVSGQASETDLAWGDLDGDGWTDLLVARKQPHTSLGKRINFLLMNEGGVLVDRTAEFAAESDVPGDFGFSTATNDRDIVTTDVNLDGLLDVVTAVTLSDSDPKHISHPRIYLNKGSSAGSWQGLRFENSRFPQLYSNSSGLPQAPRFQNLAAGDVTGNGAPDLYFADHDSSGNGGAGQPAGADLDDRLLINDALGFFVDESLARMTEQQLQSDYGMHPQIADFDQDGVNDIIALSTRVPKLVKVIRNDFLSVGTFNSVDFLPATLPYSLGSGDLNNDGRLDIVIGSDESDNYRLNLGTNFAGDVVWGPTENFTLFGGDNEFAGNTLIADVDSDGRNEVLITDVDADVPAYFGRLHIYHNDSDGPAEVVLAEERQGPSDNGWIGAVGLSRDDLGATYDVAVADFDRDGDQDLVISRTVGTYLFDGKADPVTCQTDLGFGGPGNVNLSVCGQPLFENNSATVLVEGAPAGAPGVFAYSFALNPVPLFGGTLVVLTELGSVAFTADGGGSFSFPFTAGPSPLTLYAQAACIDVSLPELVAISNAVAIEFNP